jgi:hypothetical protein
MEKEPDLETRPELSAAVEAPATTAQFLRAAMLIYKSMAQTFVKADSASMDAWLQRGRRMLREMGPRDPVEELLITQLLWTEARLAYLNHFSLQQNTMKNIRGFHDLTNDAIASLGKLVNSLVEYRRPRRRSFVTVRNANIARKQIVTNIGRRKDAGRVGQPLFKKTAQAPQLPVDAARAAVASASHPAEPALEKELRPEDADRENHLPPERT